MFNINIIFNLNLIVLFIGLSQTNASEKVNCSRIDSDIVRKFLYEKIIPAYSKLNAKIPENCIWRNERDVFGQQYLMIKRISEENWRCDLCGKEFYSESYLWQHMDNKHSNQLYQGQNSVCLANFCPLFRCEIITNHYNRPARTNWAQKLCNHHEMIKLKSQCRKIVDQCLQLDIANYQILKDYLLGTVCDFLTCENYWQASLKANNWALNVYIGIAVFAIGLVVYYMALFVRLNKIDVARYDSASQYQKLHPQPHYKHRDIDLTYRGKRGISRD